MRIVVYENKFADKWDKFVLGSKNGTFLLLRNYMDYHQDRFKDMSLMIFDENDLLAVLPANQQEDVVISHQGLTYGGLIYDHKMRQPNMLAIFQLLTDFLIQHGIKQFIYKTIPHIYHRGPADEDRYALFLLNAHLKRRDVLTVIDNGYNIPFQKRRQRSLKKAKSYGLTIKQVEDFTIYWSLLETTLRECHATTPVHSLTEIQLLAELFPENIKLFNCYENQNLLAGVVVYETERVAHFQYIASSAEGKLKGALDLLFATLIQQIYASKPYIDFGISNEEEGRSINHGLIDYKEGFGGRSVVHDFYKLEL